MSIVHNRLAVEAATMSTGLGLIFRQNDQRVVGTECVALCFLGDQFYAKIFFHRLFMANQFHAQTDLFALLGDVNHVGVSCFNRKFAEMEEDCAVCFGRFSSILQKCLRARLPIETVVICPARTRGVGVFVDQTRIVTSEYDGRIFHQLR